MTTNTDTYTVHTVTVPVTMTVTIEVTGARDAEHARQLATAAAAERTWLEHRPPMAGEWPLVEIHRIDGPTGECQFGAPHDYGQPCDCSECVDPEPPVKASTLRRGATWQERALLIGCVLVGIIGAVLVIADYTGRV